MNQRIINHLTTNVTRIFIEYGWTGKGCPKNYLAKKAYIAYGLTHGYALDFLTHLKMLAQAREKTQQWGIFTSTYVLGTITLLEKYGTAIGLFTIKPTQPLRVDMFDDIELPVQPKDNLFTATEQGRAALRRLGTFEKTNIAYELVEMYGIERLRSDYAAFYPHGSIDVQRDDYPPMHLMDGLNVRGQTKYTLYSAIMPLVILTKEVK